jgi:hypothetical protein
MERWAAINQEDIHLATIRVYTDSSRIKLLLPQNPANPDEPEEYELDMVHESVDNQLVVAEKEKEQGSRARTTILAGKVKHECNLRPVFTEKYRRRMRERVRMANTPQRQIKMIEEVTPGGRGGINMLSSGVSNTTGFSDLIVSYSGSCLCSVIDTAPRNQNQNLQRVNSSAWLVFPKTSCSICSSSSSRRKKSGRSKSCEKRPSSPKRTSKKPSSRLRSCTGAETTTVSGSFERISGKKGYVSQLKYLRYNSHRLGQARGRSRSKLTRWYTPRRR